MRLKKKILEVGLTVSSLCKLKTWHFFEDVPLSDKDIMRQWNWSIEVSKWNELLYSSFRDDFVSNPLYLIYRSTVTQGT